MSATADTSKAVHDSLKGYLQDGEIPVAWALTVEVATPDGARYLSHHHGGGYDGTEPPSLWAVIGMVTAAADDARAELRDVTRPVDDEDEAES